MWAFSDFSPIFKLNQQIQSGTWWTQILLLMEKKAVITHQSQSRITIPTIETVQKNPRFEFNHGVNTVINRAI